MSCNKVIVCTSINSVTEAIRKFDSLFPDWVLVVVGDAKTPKNYSLKNGEYISLDDQKKMEFEIIKLLPENCYERKNIGYLYAKKYLKADIIASVDDDNIPLSMWGDEGISEHFDGCEINIQHDTIPVINYLGYIKNDNNIWNRGFPIEYINDQVFITEKRKENIKIGVQANLWSGDPDVDAIHRFVFGEKYYDFPMVYNIISNKVFSPYNSQNTMFDSRLLPLHMLPIDIGRMSDIWSSYMTQKAMWQEDYHLLFGPPTVFQKRNLHDLHIDMDDELLGYRHTGEFIKHLHNLDLKSTSMIDSYIEICENIEKLEYIPDSFRCFWRAWMVDIERLI